MKTAKKAYTGIDDFRLVAALLVVAIHTSPLASCNELGDFLLTRITARVAVPFFFMTSGFFMISRYACDNAKLQVFLKKTAWIYGISIVLYLPLNLYNGYFSEKHLLTEILRDLLFDGTMYHLWYLPASMIGAAIAWYAVRRWGFKRALAVTVILYLVGLFGDSYYGLASEVPFLKNLYAQIFDISDYTRNGFFFAPIFFVLGGIAAEITMAAEINFSMDKDMKRSAMETDQKNKVLMQSYARRKCLIGFGISFLLMCMEGMILHALKLQRHDSMYIFLLPCVYFLFRLLTFWRGTRRELMRAAALVIYIMHPMMIVVIRLIAKLTGLQTVFIENSLVHYLAVCLLSVSSALSFVILWRRLKKNQKPVRFSAKDRAWLEVDSNNLKHNVMQLKNAMQPGCELMAVVKAQAYGHGMYETATYLNQMGVRAFAVATIDEGIRLRRCGILGEILILGYTNPERARELHRYDLTQTLIDYSYSRLLNKQGWDIKTHIKIDTGMHRLGFGKEDIEKIIHVFKMRHLRVCGIYTHLCVADSQKEEDIRFTNIQINRFYGLLEKLKKKGVAIPKIHIQSSYGLLNYPKLRCDYVRLGIAMYGVLSSPYDKTKLQMNLRPVLSLKSKVILLRKIKRGERVGYGRTFVAQRDTLLAVVPVGYADGMPRNLSCGHSHAIIQGQIVPVIGRICMDQLTLDVTDVENISVDDIVTLFGRDGEIELPAPGVADNAGSITNELLSRMGGRLPHVVV